MKEQYLTFKLKRDREVRFKFVQQEDGRWASYVKDETLHDLVDLLERENNEKVNH